MADEAALTSAPASPSPVTPVTQAQPTSGQAAPQAQAQPTGQDGQGQSSQPKVNLFELEDFKKYQSQQEKRFTQERQQSQVQLAQLQRQLQELRVQSIPEDERAAFEVEEIRRQNAELQQQIEYNRLMTQKYADIQKLSTKSGVSVDDLWKFETFAEAAEYALEHTVKSKEADVERLAEELIKKREAARSDLGGGAPVTTEELDTRNRKDAIKRKDGKAFVLDYLKSRS